MNKKLLTLVAVVLLFSLMLTACGKGEAPDEAVKNALTAVKNIDWKTVQKYFGTEELFNGSDSGDLTEDEETLRLIFGNLDFNIISADVNKNTATVKTELTNVDMSKIFEEYFQEAMALALENAFAGDDTMSDEELEAQIFQLLIDLLEREGNETVTSTVDIKLSKQGNSWIIDADDEFLDAMMGGLFSLSEELEDTFESEE
ncbi:MAG: DUF5105 domain-containing protein [Clostridiaceae bacterium]|jgi:ABC-type antimicrobial peptide transport system permease subunit|nr:DUF5105 domain-containing protein [Clostridiaceae bacterium]